MEEIKQVPSNLPKPSFWPIVLAFGMVLVAIGVIYTVIVGVLGIIVVLAAMAGWVVENRERAPLEESEEEG